MLKMLGSIQNILELGVRITQGDLLWKDLLANKELPLRKELRIIGDRYINGYIDKKYIFDIKTDIREYSERLASDFSLRLDDGKELLKGMLDYDFMKFNTDHSALEVRSRKSKEIRKIYLKHTDHLVDDSIILDTLFDLKRNKIMKNYRRNGSHSTVLDILHTYKETIRGTQSSIVDIRLSSLETPGELESFIKLLIKDLETIKLSTYACLGTLFNIDSDIRLDYVKTYNIFIIIKYLKYYVDIRCEVESALRR